MKQLPKLQKIIFGAVCVLVLAAGVTLAVFYSTGVLKFAKPAKSESGKYLVCYFVGNAREEERIPARTAIILKRSTIMNPSFCKRLAKKACATRTS